MARPEDSKPLGDSISEIIDRTTTIVHEEIELAKAEISVALQDLLRGSVAGIVGGVFAFFGLFILLIAFSFLVADAVGVLYPWLGFFIVAFICFLVGGLLAFVALKKIKKGSQIVPAQAIDEAKQTRTALKADQEQGEQLIEAEVVEEVPAQTATTVEAKPVPAVTPAGARTETPAAEETATEKIPTEAESELEAARDEADELEVDAKEAKRLAKQEAKEAKEAAKAAKKAEADAAKAAAVATRKAEKAAREAEKQAAKDAKQAAKAAKKAGNEAERSPASDQAESGAQQSYAPPQPPQQQPQTPPPPPNDPTGGE